MRPNYDPRQEYIGTGNQSVYTFDFKITDPTHLLVICLDENKEELWRVRGNDITELSSIAFDANNGGGSITLPADLTLNYNLILLLADDSPTQPNRFRNAGDWQIKRVEDSLDYLSGQIQRLAYLAARSLRLTDDQLDTEPFDTTVPRPQADSVIVWNAVTYKFEWIDRGAFIGPQGIQGLAATIQVGTVTTVPNSDPATIINSGTVNDAVFDFEIPEGPKGDKGDSSYTIYTEPTDPDPSDGIDLDMWINVTTGDLFQKLLGVWDLRGNIMGPMGPAGGVNSVDTEQGDLTFTWSGFSTTLNRFVSPATLRDAIAELLDMQYMPPSIVFTASGSGTLREKGTAVTSTNLEVDVVKNSDDIVKVEFKKDGVSIYDEPAPSPGSDNYTYVWTGSFNDNSTFSVEVTDDGTTGGPTTQTASRTFNFVYPYYAGADVPSLSAANVANLTKRVIASTATRAETMTSTSGDVFYFAYPASYGALTSILDENNFETIGDWTLRTENITGLDSNAVSYRIYEFNNPVAAITTTYTFKR